MKNLLKLGGLILALVLTTNLAQAQQKIGYMNSTAVLSLMPEMKAAETTLEASKEQYQKKGAEMIQTLQADYQKVQQLVAEGGLSPKQQETEGKRLQGEEQKIAQYEQKMVADLQKKEAELLQPILTKLQDAINAVAKEGGYTYVLNDVPGAGSIILFKEPGNNLTEAVIKKMNLTVPAAPTGGGK